MGSLTGCIGRAGMEFSGAAKDAVGVDDNPRDYAPMIKFAHAPSQSPCSLLQGGRRGCVGTP